MVVLLPSMKKNDATGNANKSVSNKRKGKEKGKGKGHSKEQCKVKGATKCTGSTTGKGSGKGKPRKSDKIKLEHSRLWHKCYKEKIQQGYTKEGAKMAAKEYARRHWACLKL